MMDDHHFTIAGEGIWATRAVDSMEARHYFPPAGASVLEKTALARAQLTGGIVVTNDANGVKINYRSVSDSRPVAGIYNVNGVRLAQLPMSGEAGASKRRFEQPYRRAGPFGKRMLYSQGRREKSSKRREILFRPITCGKERLYNENRFFLSMVRTCPQAQHGNSAAQRFATDHFNQSQYR